MSTSRRGLLTAAVVPVAVLCIVLGVPLFAIGTSSEAKPGGSVAGIPDRVLRAYRAVDGWCPGLRWQLLAGIGSIESGQGTSGGASADPDSGEVVPHIFGIQLDGSPGILHLSIGTWLGWFGLAGPFQQAVGPMQFLPGTFEASAVDQDGDGVANPHDIDDAVATAANYLCGGRTGAITDERAALRRYNNDDSYVTRVLDYADQVGSGDEIDILCPVAGPTTFTNTWLAPRSGGRQHKGVDIFADEGTPVVATVSGDVEMAEDSLGGLAFHLWGDDGHYYYGTHLAGFAGTSRRVTAGELIGYVGRTGNADETARISISRSNRTDRVAPVRVPWIRLHRPPRPAPPDSRGGRPIRLGSRDTLHLGVCLLHHWSTTGHPLGRGPRVMGRPVRISTPATARQARVSPDHVLVGLVLVLLASPAREGAFYTKDTWFRNPSALWRPELRRSRRSDVPTRHAASRAPIMMANHELVPQQSRSRKVRGAVGRRMHAL